MLATCLLAALQSVHDSPAIDLAWAPEPCAVLERQVEFDLRMGLVDALPGAGVFVPFEDSRLLLSVSGRVHVRDEFLRFTGGQPLEVEREVLGLRTDWDGLLQFVAVSELEGRNLHYSRDDAREDFTRTWSRARAEDRPPPALREDLDLRALLPDGPVRQGEVWRVPVSRAAEILAPAGAQHVDLEALRVLGLEALSRSFEIENLRRIRDGEVECLLARVEGDEAVIEFGWSWWGAIEPLLSFDDPAWRAQHLGGSLGVDIDGRAWGVLRWDLDAHHARSLELTAEVDGTFSGRWPFRARGTWWYQVDSR